MSNALRNVAESTAHVWSDLVDEARDLVDDARDRIEDLPPLARARRRNNNRRLMLIVIVAALGLVVLMARRRRHHHDADGQDSTASARMAEKSLAVS